MKTIKRIFCIIFALCLVLPFTACGGGEELEAPTWLDLDDDYVLTWEDVGDARSYEIGITDLAADEMRVESSRRATYSLADLPVGDYSVCVRSVGGKQNDIFSQWSQSYEFHRDRESGLLYSSINNNTEYAVSKVGSASGEITIDDEYRGKPVTAIANAAFRSAGSRVTGVTFGKNIKTIGESAFYNCTGLKSITIPDTVVSIGASAFQNCTSLETVKLSVSIATIPDYAFAHCTSLKTLEIEGAVVTIGASAFTTCTALTKVVLSDTVASIGEYAFNEDDALTEVVFGSGIRAIGEYAFYGCDVLETLQFPEQLAEGNALSLGNYAFASCASLERADLPAGTVSLGNGCFSYSAKFADITIPASVTSIGSYTFNETALYESQKNENFIYADNWLLACSDDYFEELTVLDGSVLFADTVGIADYAFIRLRADGYVGCPSLQRIDLPASVKYIGKYAFYNTPKLTELFAQRGGLERVDDHAFVNCSNLGNIRFSDGLLSIGQYAFSGCTMLYNNSVDARYLIPQTVKRVGAYAFSNTGLWSVRDEYGVIYAGNWVVGYVGNEPDITLRSGDIDGIADYAFYQPELLSNNGQQTISSSNLGSVRGLGRVRNIGAGAFYYCVQLASVSLGDNVRTIEGYTFAHCASLLRVTMPTMLTAIDSYAFYNCTGLISLDLSESRVETIGQRAFYGCANLQTIDFGDSLRSIGVRAFYKCSSLQSVTIPGTVKEIGGQAFAKSKLTSLTMEEGIERIGESAFRNTGVLEIRIPNSVKEIGDCAFYGTLYCTKLELGSGLERIGRYAFGLSIGIESVVIPAGVKEIGAYAFAGCISLRSAIFRGAVSELGMHAFYLCPALTLFMADGVEIEAGSWNSSFRPMIYGCTLSGDGKYIVSVDTSRISYSTALGGLSDPVRDGYDFVGWATEQGGEVRYQTNELADIDEQVVYAVYRFHSEESSGGSDASQE